MKIEEVIEILENGGWWDLFIPITTIEGRSDEDKLHQAIDMAISALRSMQENTKSGWISVKERLPNEEDDVLILVREIEHYGRHHEKREVYYWQFVGWRVDEKWATTYCHGFRYIDDENEKEPRCEHEVTHWMPLPEPPEEERL